MHFAKTYTELLRSLPPELRDGAIEYRRLKKLVRGAAAELESIGLSPDRLRALLDAHADDGQDEENPGAELAALHPCVRYEFAHAADGVAPRLRFILPGSTTHLLEGTEEMGEPRGEDALVLSTARPPALLYALQRGGAASANGADARSSASVEHEIIVPLVHDSEFFRALETALHALAVHLSAVQASFLSALSELAASVSASARPLSAGKHARFRPHAAGEDAGAISTPLLFARAPALASDLDAWRAIFAIYVECAVFEAVEERGRGRERSVGEAEKRLKAFAERVTGAGLGDGRTLKSAQSRAALDEFLRMNVFLLDLTKFQQASAEAMRKILKKHAKRTALPLPLLTDTEPAPDALALAVPALLTTLPRALVQAIGTQLLPVVPALDDYACIICTELAFKPIRLRCAHLFCVRCLVKLQKRGRAHCPMCRAPTVVQAGRANVDWALVNFMQDWFPAEAFAKLRANEREAHEEEMRELGIEPGQGGCAVQ